MWRKALQGPDFVVLHFCVLDLSFGYSIITVQYQLESDADKMTSFTTDNKKVDVFPAVEPCRPVIYLNIYGHGGKEIFQYLQNSDCPDFTLVAISNLEWEHDMVPWDIPSISEKTPPCIGGADAYLNMLLDEILPKAETFIPGRPLWRGIAGYSLAGLFAVYAIYQTNTFSRVASISGSLWFPGIKEYIFSREPEKRPDCIYFSLGDRECHTQNPFLQSVQESTEEISIFYQKKGISTAFQLNPGNHFKNSVKRTVSGIQWILTR